MDTSNNRPPPAPERIVGALHSLPHCHELGMEAVAVEACGRATVRVAFQERLIGNPETGLLHGGVITTLLDTASGLAVVALMPEGTSLATLDLRVDHLRPGVPGLPVYATAECYRRASHVVFVRGSAYQDKVEEPIASCVATFMLGATGFSLDQARDGLPEAP